MLEFLSLSLSRESEVLAYGKLIRLEARKGWAYMSTK